MQMTHYEELKDGVQLHFANGQPAVHAKLLIRADGYFSKIRQQCLNDGPPDFVVCWKTCLHAYQIMLQSVDT